ncbi:hypothetical protein LUR56_30900 [Streptomyces sp. MT29]|nr:hypothetical protein [Streptomyces sp. MT29]
MSRRWEGAVLDELPGVQVVGYGINRPGSPDASGVPMVRAGDVLDGRIRSAEVMRVGHDIAKEHAKTRLRPGDVLIVLVGRIGEAVLTGPEHDGWNVGRSVALVRCADPDLAEWLRVWLTMPTARAWCESQAVGTAQRTLTLRALRQLPVELPPSSDRERVLRVVRAIEERIGINERIAHTTVALADAHFAQLASARTTWPRVPFRDVVRTARTGTAATQAETADGARGVAPADLLRSTLPYVGGTDDSHAAAFPGSVLVVSRAGQVHAAVSRTSVAVGRGVLVLDLAMPDDAWWLLHEIRSRSGELAQLAQGTAGRELSARAFVQAEVAWPPKTVLARFAGLAGKLHERAIVAEHENRKLRDFWTHFLRTVDSAGAPPGTTG